MYFLYILLLRKRYKIRGRFFDPVYLTIFFTCIAHRIAFKTAKTVTPTSANTASPIEAKPMRPITVQALLHQWQRGYFV